MDSWQSLLRTPAPCDHVVQLYTDDTFLTRAVTHYLGSGLARGEAAVLLATPAHADAISHALADGLDVGAAFERRQLTVLDARSCLAGLMVDGLPDRERFTAIVRGLLDEVTEAGWPRLRLFGEMVDLIWYHNLPATMRLEELWNEALATRDVSLLCGYRIDNFDRHAHHGVLREISRRHSHLVPVEDYDRFERAVDRAYREVFGPGGDAALLRQLFGHPNGSPTAMPPGQQALVALRDLRRDLADDVLDRTRAHYLAA